MGKKTVQVPYHQLWDEQVKRIAGGLTIQRAAKGIWLSKETGKTHKELMIPVRIVCTKADIMLIAAVTVKHYQQEKVLVMKISDECFFFPLDTSNI